MQQLGEMLSTSASQYINPDYYNPLPTTLDAKKSPLAMLAQTCSSIGKDPSTKSIIPPLEKKDAEKQQLEKSTPAENETKDSNTKESADTNDKPKFRSVVHKDVPALVPVSRSKEEKSATPTSKSSPKPKDVTITTASASSQSERASVSSRSPHSRHSVPDDHRRRPESPRSPRHVPRSIASDYDVSKAGQSASFSSYPYFSHPGLSADALAGYPYGLHSHAAAAALAAQSSALAAQSSAEIRLREHHVSICFIRSCSDPIRGHNSCSSMSRSLLYKLPTDCSKFTFILYLHCCWMYTMCS